LVLVAKKGKKGEPFSRLIDGRPVLFINSHPLSLKIEIGDIVEAEIIHEKQTYVLAKPIRVVKQKTVIEDDLATLIELSGTYLFQLSPTAIKKYKDILTRYEDLIFKIRAERLEVHEHKVQS